MPTRKSAAHAASSDWLNSIRESWHEVFLAGLASLARARKPGLGGGRTDFETLVAEGRKLEPEVRKALRKTWDEWRERSWPPLSFNPEGRLQELFEARVSAVLVRLGVPTRKEFADLVASVDALRAAPGVRTARRAAAKKNPTRAAAKAANASAGKIGAER